MKKEELFETMGNLDLGMVEKAGKYQRSRRAAWKKWMATAACAGAGCFHMLHQLRHTGTEGMIRPADAQPHVVPQLLS